MEDYRIMIEAAGKQKYRLNTLLENFGFKGTNVLSSSPIWIKDDMKISRISEYGQTSITLERNGQVVGTYLITVSSPDRMTEIDKFQQDFVTMYRAWRDEHIINKNKTIDYRLDKMQNELKDYRK